MTSLANVLISPIISIKKRFNHRLSSSTLDAPPPPVDTTKQWDFGSYCWKVTVEATNKKEGDVDRTFIGYSQNMDIAKRTEIACDRYKKSGTVCGEVTMSMKGGECDDVIFMKLKNATELIKL